ncbi:Elongin-A [Araneus ventricosus]|uniref:Elongin-A n=1 Tax=Araneus ventricosus TaxID=182803 RepID=A0A4Y2BI61_ARAVE|nr:Elongin-A [Araneus ventricosus]
MVRSATLAWARDLKQGLKVACNAIVAHFLRRMTWISELFQYNRHRCSINGLFTKWPEAIPIPDQEASIVEELMKLDFMLWLPMILHGSRTNFNSALFTELCKLLGILKTRDDRLHPWSDGMILNVIHKLSKVPVTVELLQDTGIGKVIRSLAKKSGKVGVKATAVLHNWRELVSSAQKSPDNSLKAAHSKHSSSKSERKEERDDNKSRKKSTSSHERQNNREKKSSSFSGKQHLNVSEHSSRSYSNDDSDYASYHHGFNSTSKTSNTDESDVETSSIANSSYSGKRKSFETSPSNTENHVSETKRLKTNSGFSLSDSSQYRSGSEKQSSHGSHKKKDKEKKSHDSRIQNDAKASQNSHSHNGFSKSSENEKSSSKKPKKNKDNDKKSHSGVKKALKIKPTESFTSSEARFEDCLNFSDIVPVKKKKSSKTSTDKKEKYKESSSKNAVVEKSRPKETAVGKSTAKLSPMPLTTKFPEQDKNSFPSLLSDSAQKSLPKISEVDILSTLPQTQPNYRPLPQRNFDSLPSKKKVLTNEDAIKFTSSRKERTNVYSGRKSLFYTEMPTLFECCTRVLIENIDAIEYLGEVPYFLLKPVLERCTPLQLYNIEHYNPYLLDDTHELWEAQCKRDFRSEKLQENETWRELYLRAFEERERKLKNITANISASMSKSGPARQVKLAYVNTVAKPPRDVARKQVKMGTALPVDHTVKAGPSSKASPRPSAPAVNSAASSSKSEYSIPKKPKVAPLMAKTLKSMKQCYRR